MAWLSAQRREYLCGLVVVLMTVSGSYVTAQVGDEVDDYSLPSDGVEAPTPTPMPLRPERLTSGFGADSGSGDAAIPETTTIPAEATLVTPPPPPALTSTAGPALTPLPPLSRAVETLKLQASLAENGYGIDKSESSALALIVAYERLIGPLCMPALHRTLSHPGAPTDPRCLEYMDKIVALDPENPIVLCARDGIDAQTCRSAFAAQQIETFIPGSSAATWTAGTPRPTDSLNEQLAVSSVESKAQPIMSRINLLEYQLRSNRALSAEDREKLVKSYREGLDLSCRLTKLELRGTGPTKPTLNIASAGPLPAASPTQPPLFPGLATGTKRKSPFDEVLEQFGGAPPTPASLPAKDGRVRIRKITDRCKDLVNRALRFDRRMALPICYRDGFYSPACIDARRREGTAPDSGVRSEASGKAPATNAAPPGGFSTF